MVCPLFMLLIMFGLFGQCYIMYISGLVCDKMHGVSIIHVNNYVQVIWTMLHHV